MVRAGQAKRRGGARRCAEIEHLHSLPKAERRVSSAPSAWQYAGQNYTRREEIKHGDDTVGHVLQLKRIDPRDHALFLLSVTDCMSTREAK
jgi:hypothetical protein